MSKLHWLVVVLLSTVLMASPTWALELKRADYSLTLPVGAQVDEEDSSDDPDHYTSVDLADDGVLIVAVIDDGSGLPVAMSMMQDSLRESLNLNNTAPSNAFTVVKGDGVRLSSSGDADKHIIELGGFNGSAKGYILVYGFLQKNEKTALQGLQTILHSFRIHETHE